MYRITARRGSFDVAPRAPAPETRIALAVLALFALALLSWYVHVLRDQVVRAQQFRAELQLSGVLVAKAKPPVRRQQVVAAGR